MVVWNSQMSASSVVLVMSHAEDQHYTLFKAEKTMFAVNEG